VVRKFIFSFISFSLFSFISVASVRFNQNDSAKYIIETKLHYGFVLSHHKNMAYLTTGHFPCFEINIGKQTRGEQKWQPLYKYPVMGISFWYSNLANPDILGSAYALYPYLNFHLLRNPSFSLNYRFGIGLGYLTKKFDRLDNYKNIAIGTHLNATINMFYELKWMVFQKFYVSGSLGITHFSNGAIKFPNLGINIPTVSAGIAYIFPSKTLHYQLADKNVMNISKNKIDIISILSGSVKEMYPSCGDKFGAFSFTTSFLKPLSIKRKIDAGFDLFWDFSNIRTLKCKNIEIKRSYEAIRYGIHIGHQLEFSHLSFITQLGYYLYAKDKSDGPVFMRIGMRYKLTKKILFNLAIKTHYAKADFLECGIGYFIN
jgi:hypothetical protein